MTKDIQEDSDLINEAAMIQSRIGAQRAIVGAMILAGPQLGAPGLPIPALAGENIRTYGSRAVKTFSVDAWKNRTPIPRRNDPCSCGSGKKWKRCCGK